MIKNLFSLLFCAVSITVSAQSFTATFDFAATNSLTGTTDPTPSPTVTGITCGSFVAVGTGTASGSTARFSFNGWPIATLSGSTSAASYTAMGGVIDLSKYYEITLSPVSGYSVTLDSMMLSTRRTGTGPRSFAIRSSADTYSNNLPASATNTLITIEGTNEFFYSADLPTSSAYQSGNKITTSNAAFIGFTSPITFRIYSWNAESALGNFGIDDVSFYGSVSVPTGIATIKYDLNSNFNIYPVPSYDGVVFIENKDFNTVSKIEVVDVLGKVINTSTTTNDSKIKLNLSEIPQGNYFVKIYSGKNVTTKKITVLK